MTMIIYSTQSVDEDFSNLFRKLAETPADIETRKSMSTGNITLDSVFDHFTWMKGINGDAALAPIVPVNIDLLLEYFAWVDGVVLVGEARFAFNIAEALRQSRTIAEWELFDVMIATWIEHVPEPFIPIFVDVSLPFRLDSAEAFHAAKRASEKLAHVSNLRDEEHLFDFRRNSAIAEEAMYPQLSRITDQLAEDRLLKFRRNGGFAPWMISYGNFDVHLT
jgi:predicted outer membrane lipoprotein